MNRIFLIFFCFVSVTTATAQFGVRAGFNSAKFSNSSDFTSIGGFNYGVYYTGYMYNLKGKKLIAVRGILIGKYASAIKSAGLLSIEPGVQYSRKGYAASISGKGEITEKLGYIDIPVLARLNLTPSINVFVGPQASLLVSRNYSIDKNTESTSLEPIRGYDLGAVAGIGATILGGINFQVSYDLGLTSLNYFDIDVRNRVLKFSMGYFFGN